MCFLISNARAGELRFPGSGREERRGSAAGAPWSIRSPSRWRKLRTEQAKNCPPRLALRLVSASPNDHHHATRIKTRSQRGQARIPVEQRRTEGGLETGVCFCCLRPREQSSLFFIEDKKKKTIKLTTAPATRAGRATTADLRPVTAVGRTAAREARAKAII